MAGFEPLASEATALQLSHCPGSVGRAVVSNKGQKSNLDWQKLFNSLPEAEQDRAVLVARDDQAVLGEVVPGFLSQPPEARSCEVSREVAVERWWRSALLKFN